MPRKRLTRAEARERTRQRLLDAAAASIAKKGLAATSVEDIAAQAGYTRGAFYSNFGSKNELFAELLRHDHENVRKSLKKLLDAALSGEDMHEQLVSLYARRRRDKNNYVIWSEARLHAMRDATFRQCVRVLCLETRDTIAYFVEQVSKRLNMQLPCSFADYALAVIALMDGLLYFSMTIPDELSNASAEAIFSNVVTRMFFNPFS